MLLISKDEKDEVKSGINRKQTSCRATKNAQVYCPAKENVAIDQKFDEMWEKL